MKKTLLLLVTILINPCLSVNVQGEIEVKNEDGIWLSYDYNDDRTGVIVTQPPFELSGRIVIPSEITFREGKKNVTYPVVGIDYYAFESFTRLTEIFIPSSVKNIGDGAFSGCEQLSTIHVPDEILSIGARAFESTAITSINIGSKITKLSNELFLKCEQLKSIRIPDGVKTLGKRVFSNSGIEHIDIGRGITTISEGAFYECIKLKQISFPDNVKTIEKDAFYGCQELTDLDLGDVTSIGANAFCGCAGSSSLDLSNVTQIGGGAFAGWMGLRQIDLSNVEILKAAFIECDSLRVMKFSNKLQEMTQNTCVSVNEIRADELGTLFRVKVKSDVSIDYYIGGEKLNELTIPEGTTTIPASCLQNISAATIILPASLTKIESNALCNAAPEKLYCYATNPPEVASYTFTDHMKNTVLFVPYGTKEAYKAATNWKRIVSIVELPGEEESQTVTVAEAGGLRMALSELEVTKVKSLVIKGQLNAADLALIRAREGRLSTLEQLDLSNVTFVPSEEPYLTYTRVYDGSFMQHQYRFFIANERKDTTWMAGLSQAGPAVHDRYDYCLPMAFMDMPLKRVVLPASFNEIGDGIFSGCKSLETVVAPSSLVAIGTEAFKNCENLMTIPELSKVIKLGGSAFYGCLLLQVLDERGEIVLSSLDSIPRSAFDNCRNIKAVTLSDKLRSIDEYAFSNTGLLKFVLPSSVKEIAAHTFLGCSSLTDVQLPDNLYRIGREAFRSCTSLTNINIPQQLCRIGYDAFSGTPWYDNQPLENGVKYAGNVAMESKEVNMVFREGTTGIADGFNGNDGSGYYNNKVKDYPVSVTLPSSLRYIGNSAFYLAPITTVTLPKELGEIGAYAFRGTALEVLKIPEGVTEIGEFAFANNVSLLRLDYQANIGITDKTDNGYLFSGCKALERVTIGPNVKVINDRDFENCSGLLKIDLSEGLQIIGQYAFMNCSYLKEIKLPETLKEIRTEAIYGTAIESIELPAGISSLSGETWPYGAFYGCDKLTTIISHIEEPFEIHMYTFDNKTYTNGKLYVPLGSKSNYEGTEGWNRFKKIVEFPSPDVNQDEDVNEQDVVDIAHFVVGTPSDSFYEFLADINNDGVVNLGDAVVVVNEIIGSQNNVKAKIASTRYEEQDEVMLKDINGTLSLCMNNNRQYTAYQFDLYLPENAEVTKLILNTNRNQDHQLFYNKVEEGLYRVAVLSTSNKEFNGNEGELLNMTINGVSRDDVSIHAIHFFDSRGNDYQFYNIDSSIETNIESLNSAFSKGEGEIYDLSGRKMFNVQCSMFNGQRKGIYIIRMKDGTTKKAMIK